MLLKVLQRSSQCYKPLIVKRFIKRFAQVIPKYAEEFLTNTTNLVEIEANIKRRKGIGNIKLIHELNSKLKSANISQSERSDVEAILQREMRLIPNDTHPDVREYGDEPKTIKVENADKYKYTFEPKEFSDLASTLNVLRTEHLGNFSGHKSYFLMNDLADLEQALIQYSIDHLIGKRFEIVTVPDILPERLIESCGMVTSGDRTLIYRLLPSNLCLSGTSEMALAGLYAGKTVPMSELPIRLSAVSRCFRAETSGLQEEKGIYRVHHFTKVEMFSICAPHQSTQMLDEFRAIEEELFSNLGLHFRVLDMPPSELGAPAYRKYDIEAWLPGRRMWGEISSCSDCKDFQARRLGTQMAGEDDVFAHTVNGTACAVPRMLIAILETYQNRDGSINIPEVLRKYIRRDVILKSKDIPKLKLIKNIPREVI